MSGLLSFNVFMTHIFFPFNLSSFNPVMLKNPSNKFSSSWNCFNSYLYMHLRLGSFSKSSWWYVMSQSLYFSWNPPSCLCKGPRVVPAGPMLFCALQKISGGIGGGTRFIYLIISHWAAIRWEGYMFHDLSEVDLGFEHLRCDCLEIFQGDAAGYWLIIRGIRNQVIGNTMWSVVGWGRGIPGGWAVS